MYSSFRDGLMALDEQTATQWRGACRGLCRRASTTAAEPTIIRAAVLRKAIKVGMLCEMACDRGCAARGLGCVRTNAMGPCDGVRTAVCAMCVCAMALRRTKAGAASTHKVR
mmetsp:Transcript_1438/g.2624  ORF Transcript_1438/g.2624 Transcript_1438/m.2624 type:complete len:112 (-) Transcript_1438:180-515(-)